MTRQLITETSLAGLRPTGVGGVRVLESWEQISGYLRSLPGGGDLADLFAEPVPQGGGKIMWFAGEGGTATPFRDLSPERQAAARETLAGMLARLEDETARLEASSNPAARLIGETLRQAQQLPGAAEDCLYVMSGDGQADRPMLINWSTEPEGAPPPLAPLKEFIRQPAGPPPPLTQPSAAAVPPVAATVAAAPPVVAPAPAAVWPLWPWLWLLFFLLLGAIYYLLLVGCAVWPGWRPLNYCPVPVVAEPPPVDPGRRDNERTPLLLAELSRLEQQLAQAPRCPEPPRHAQTVPPPQEDFDRRVAENRAQEGELTVTLLWDTPSDLDLHVACPNGQVVNFANRSICGGRLDVDANASSPRPSPVENIYFAAGDWSPGVYRVLVRNHAHRGGEADNFKVRVKKGDQVTIYEGRVGHKKTTPVIDVEMP